MPGPEWIRGEGIGDNAVFSASGYGTKTCKVIRIAHGMNIIAKEDASRNHHGFYPFKRTSGSFGLTAVFAERSERDDFSRWVENYIRLASDPTVAAIGPMRVVMASIDFDKTAVPSSSAAAASYGDVWNAVVYRVEMAFEGAKDQVELDSDDVSSFVNAAKNVTGSDGSFYFYPPNMPIRDDQIKTGVAGDPGLGTPPSAPPAGINNTSLNARTNALATGG